MPDLLPACVKGAEFLVRQLHRSCANVLFEVRYLAGPRDREDGRAASEHPRERDLTRTHTSFLGDAVDEGPGFARLPPARGKKGMLLRSTRLKRFWTVATRKNRCAAPISSMVTWLKLA